LEDFREELTREDAFLTFAMGRMLAEAYSRVNPVCWLFFTGLVVTS